MSRQKSQAYLLIETNVSKTLPLEKALIKIKGVKTVSTVTGPFDIIILLEADSPEQIGQIILKKIRLLPGIVRTLTCVVVG